MKKPGIPSPLQLQAETARVLGPIKETLDIITGVKGGEMEQVPEFTYTELAEDADLVAVIASLNSVCLQVSKLTDGLNQVIGRLNRSGT